MQQLTEPDERTNETGGQDAGRAVLYIRVSSSQQADNDYDLEGFSIPAQRDALQRKAASLGLQVVEEYVDRGESGKTANRPGLQALLTRLEQGDIQAVLVHKIDRLARNRADDVAIVMKIRAAGAQLVSATENIDETPSGLLLHGIMSSIAEFYSRNLATEIMKGTTQKAKAGGTPFRAPLGYLNVREYIDGREIRTITTDPETAPLVRLMFDLYATGDYSLIDLAAILEARGLRSRASRNRPAKVLGTNRLSSILHNDYYAGIVNYAGNTSRGRHEPLVDEATFQKVQQIPRSTTPIRRTLLAPLPLPARLPVLRRVRPQVVLHTGARTGRRLRLLHLRRQQSPHLQPTPPPRRSRRSRRRTPLHHHPTHR
jgi:DNA invertase Pin-like site-specific DNA recombinase